MTYAATAPGNAKCIRCVETMKGVTAFILVVFATAVLARPHNLHTKVRSIDSHYCGIISPHYSIFISDA